jgi:DNA-binding XRE family transcriptional regulator
MKAQILEADGKPSFVILPYDEYQALLELVEDADDAAAVARFAARYDEGKEAIVPGALVERLLDGEVPIRVWRQYRGLTATQLAAAVKVTPAHISKLEAGKGSPSLALLRRLARVLEIELDLLVTPHNDD